MSGQFFVEDRLLLKRLCLDHDTEQDEADAIERALRALDERAARIRELEARVAELETLNDGGGL